MISIKKAKQIREELNLTHLVIFGVSEDGKQHVATHGKTKINAKDAAQLGNDLKKALHWPKDDCDSKPLERICENCSFWKRDEIGRGVRIPEHWPGKCMYNPTPVKRFEKDIACSKMEPDY